MLTTVMTCAGLLALLGLARWSAPAIARDDLAAFDDALARVDSIAPRRVRRV